MINKREHHREHKPFLLKPCGKEYLWGGNRLNGDFGKGIEAAALAETWECSTHPDGPRVAASGEFAGQTLADVLKKHPGYLGRHPETKGELPVLIKLIDAGKKLSVQVHPTDEYARLHENGQPGKTEMWYILDADRDTELVCGLRHTLDKEQLRESIQNGTLEEHLKKVPAKKDDVFYIEAGTIHTIGAGALVAEIQENSNLTYRLYDYDRLDRNGKKRELHIEKGLEAANLKAGTEPRQPLRVWKYRRGCVSKLLCRCKYFEVYKREVDAEDTGKRVDYQTDSSSFHALLCISGSGSLTWGDEGVAFGKGDCIFVPADSVKLRIRGKASFLDVRG